MINTLEIENFKSIKSLKIECKRINLFLGEPNTGKSNILEALGILSAESWDKINEVIRFEHLGNLFYDQNLDDKIKIDSNDRIFEIFFDQGNFIGNCSIKNFERIADVASSIRVTEDLFEVCFEEDLRMNYGHLESYNI